MLISDGGTLVRTPVSEVSVIGRNTQGVRLISLSDGELLVSVEPVADTGETSENPEADAEAGAPAPDAVVEPPADE